MNSAKQPRVIIVTRPTFYAELLAAHGTREQARFFLETREQSIDTIEQQHRQFEAALSSVVHAIPIEWRRSRIDRSDLDRFLFEPDDIVVALGQDGLVANTAKYLSGQAVIGLNPSPDRYEGTLVPLPPAAIADALAAVAAGRGKFLERTMVAAALDDGQRLLALNEIFIGHQSHQSARYRIRWGISEELQSSSGVIVSTGTGASGWARSVLRNRTSKIRLPKPTDERLVFFVREAWPSINTGTELTDGRIRSGQQLAIISRMNAGGVIFGDGIEDDRLEFNWGRRVSLQLAETKLRLLVEV